MILIDSTQNFVDLGIPEGPIVDASVPWELVAVRLDSFADRGAIK